MKKPCAYILYFTSYFYILSFLFGYSYAQGLPQTEGDGDAGVVNSPTLQPPLNAILIGGNLGGAPGGVSLIRSEIRGGAGNGFGGTNLINVDNNPPNRGSGGNGINGISGDGTVLLGGGGGAVGALTISPSVMVITGQKGGDGQGIATFVIGNQPARGSNGAGGGAGIFLDNVIMSTLSGMTITGGAGGRGGESQGANIPANMLDGSGGGGAAGMVVNGGSITNVANATIIGGIGGDAGIGRPAHTFGAAGAGGDGVVVQNGGTFLNEGLVQGATGGIGRLANHIGTAGAGIRGSDNAIIINAGLVRPGMSAGSNQGDSDSIMLVGNNGVLELRAGSNIQGPLGTNLLGRAVARANSGNVLALGGILPSNFDANEIGTKYIGFDRIRKIGVSRWDVSGENNVLPCSVEDGVLAVNAPVGGPMQVSGGRLIGTSSVESITNLPGGTVAPGDSSFAVLTDRGDYIAQGGTVEIQTVLGEDNSSTSLLRIEGNSTGADNVQVINRDGIGALTTNGIRIIEVVGQSNAIFNLNGDFVTENGNQAVVAGAFAYILQQGGTLTPNDGDWYLISRMQDDLGENMMDDGINDMPILQPGAPLYEATTQTLRLLNKLPTLQQRVGNRYWSNAANTGIVQGDGPGLYDEIPAPSWGASVDGRGIWASVGGEYSRLTPGYSTTRLTQKTDALVVRTGIDGMLYTNEAGTLIGGLVGQYGSAKANIQSPFGRGDINSQAWGLGATMTWYGEQGFYVDGQAQANWFDNDYHSVNATRSLADGKKATGYALSLEAGKQISINGAWSTTPQAQIMWSLIDVKSFKDAFGADVSFRKSSYVTGRVGITLDYGQSWNDNEGMIKRRKIFTILNIYQDFNDNNELNLSDYNLNTRNEKSWAGLGIGGTYSWKDDKYSIYSNGLIDMSFKNSSNNYTLAGNVGFRVKW